MDARDLADGLINGATYSIRTYRGSQAENPPDFQPTRLHVQHHKRQAVSVTPLDYDWAEADPRQECWISGPLLSFMAEDYCMDIEISSITRPEAVQMRDRA